MNARFPSASNKQTEPAPPTPSWLDVQRAAVEGALAEEVYTVSDYTGEVDPCVEFTVIAFPLSWSLTIYAAGDLLLEFIGVLSASAFRALAALGAVWAERDL